MCSHFDCCLKVVEEIQAAPEKIDDLRWTFGSFPRGVEWGQVW